MVPEAVKAFGAVVETVDALPARYLRGAKGDIVARRSATIAYARPGF